jgi:glycosyltransferase involved in cell wall biosynthesis
MKILSTSDTYLPRLGGGEYHVHYLNRELARMGHDVTLLTTEPGPAGEEKVLRVPYKGVFSLPVIWSALWRASKGVDVIHAHYSYRLACVAAGVAFLRRIPLVVTQHGLGLLPQAGAPLWQDLVFRVWRRVGMTVATTVISTSDDLSIDIRALGFGGKIVHIPNGYDPEQFRPLPPPPAGTQTILAVRRLVPKNGIQYMVAALPAILKRFPGARFVSVGGGRLQDEIEGLARDLGVHGSIEFLGPKSHDELADLYAAANVVVIPSTAESTSLSCIEAMALRRPIVASRVGGLVELIGANDERGYLARITDTEHCDYEAPLKIAPEKIQRLADAVIRALEHPDEALAKAGAAAAYAPGHFAWPVVAKRTVDEAYARR